MPTTTQPRLTLSLAVASALLVTGHAAPASAQSVDEVQRCVWSCLANFPGASNPDYINCVEQICNAEDSSEPVSEPEPDPGPQQFTRQSGAWQIHGLVPEEPPYLDGRSVSVTSNNGRMVFAYMCGRDGDSHMFLGGQAIRPPFSMEDIAYPTTLQIDRRGAHAHRFSEYEGQLTTAIAPGDALFEDLMAGNALVVQAMGTTARFSLRGSRQAIETAAGYCAKGPR